MPRNIKHAKHVARFGMALRTQLGCERFILRMKVGFRTINISKGFSDLVMVAGRLASQSAQESHESNSGDSGDR